MVFGDDKLITVKNKIIVKFIMLSMNITSIGNTQKYLWFLLERG